MIGYVLFTSQLFVIRLVNAAQTSDVGRLPMMVQNDFTNIRRGSVEYLARHFVLQRSPRPPTVDCDDKPAQPGSVRFFGKIL